MSEPTILQDVRARITVLEGQLPLITQAAEAAAQRIIENPEWVVRYPFSVQPSFTDEFVARAGGLLNWGTDDAGAPMSTDVILYGVRSWEEEGGEAVARIADYRAHGWLVILPASRAGMPDDLPSGVLPLDNGAATGLASENAANFICNLVLGWMWHVELVAALTRLDMRPHVYQSVFVPGANEFNKGLTPKDALLPCATAVPAGQLAAAYLGRICWLLDDMARPEIQEPIGKAAEIIAAELQQGGRVVTACLAHCLPGEMARAKNPFLALGVPKQADVLAGTEYGDLLVFFGYVGINNEYYQHGTWFREAGVRVISSFIDDPLNRENREPEALAHIPASWTFGDAEVEIPFPPGRMAPMSVVNQLLLFHTLDDAVAEKLT